MIRISKIYNMLYVTKYTKIIIIRRAGLREGDKRAIVQGFPKKNYGLAALQLYYLIEKCIMVI
jgi:hypothetical protein